MFCTLRTTLTAVLAVLCVTVTLALADDGTVSGTIQNVDPQQGRITVRAARKTSWSYVLRQISCLASRAAMS